MIIRIASIAGFSVVSVWAVAGAAQAQTFTPSEQHTLMQPSAIGGTPGTFAPPARAGGKEAEKRPGDKKDATAGKRAAPPVSISQELNRPDTNAATPVLRKPREITPQKPLDQRIPFGPLSLGLQADTAPRSDSLVTPVPEGMSQFKKDRAEPYVGVSIIDIKR